MSQYIVTALSGNINFAPSSEVEEILQNVRTIISTPKYSVPLDRGFGLSATFLDAPIPVAKARLSSEIVENVQKYEPRAQVVSVKYTGDGLTGKLVPQVVVKIA